MSNSLDSTLLSSIIQTATNQVITQTDSFVESARETPLGNDIVSVMINGVQTNLNRSDYDAMKSQNNSVLIQMKSDVRSIVNDFKANLEEELKK